MTPSSLVSPYFQFTLDHQKATWSLNGTHPTGPALEDAWMRVSYTRGNTHFVALQNWSEAEITDPRTVASPHGQLEQLTLTLGPDKNGLHFRVEFALSASQPIFLWRLTLENQGTQPLKIDRIKMLQAGFFPKRKRLPSPGKLTQRYNEIPIHYGAVRPNHQPGELAFFSNGWQSWSFTGSLGAGQRFPYTRLGFLTTNIWYNPGTPRPKKRGHFSSDMYGILGDRQHRSGILAGFLSQKQHFGSLEANTDPFYPALALWANGDETILEPGHQMTTDWAAIQFVDIDAPAPLAPYLEAVAREHALPNFTSPSGQTEGVRLGWCSWYQFYQDISAEKMQRNLKAAREIQPNLPLDLFQIDDGFQAQVGDWLEFSPDFPEGVAPLAREIRAAGFTPGIWLAPYIVHSKAQLKREHPEWLLRNRWGRSVNAGFIWNQINTALDLTHPEALDYTREVVHTAAHKWGFSFLKLDFLYAAAIKGRYQDQTRTRAQVLRQGLETLREAAGPEVHLLGCGVPLGSAIGLFDSVRIGADVDQRWKPHIKNSGKFLHKEYSVPSARNAIQNTLTRAPLHLRWWINDPDCLLLRADSELTLAEIHSLATAIALTGGPLLLSDDLLPGFPVERLRIAEQLTPLIGQSGRALDWFDAATPRLVYLELENGTGPWHLLAVFNWEDRAQDFALSLEQVGLPRGIFLAREFWGGETHLVSNGSLTLKAIPAHGVRLLALRPIQQDQASYLGSDLHISQGLEVTQWTETPTGLQLRLERPGPAQGQIELYLPQLPTSAQLDQTALPWQSLGEGRYRLTVEFSQSAALQINW